MNLVLRASIGILRTVSRTPAAVLPCGRGLAVCALVVLATVFAQGARARILDIVVVTGSESDSYDLYELFLKEIYRGSVDLDVDADRYDESLSDKKKEELEEADLIIVSRQAEGTDYNGDADFWASVDTPILNHNAKLARSDDHRFWDWLDGDATTCDECYDVEVADFNDPVFDGVDTSAGLVQIYTTGPEVEISDQGSGGLGSVVATVGGNVAIARWHGGETEYFDGSDFGPGAARLFFAAPDDIGHILRDGTDEGRLMLRNAILSLLPFPSPPGDLDGDSDVDFKDAAVLASLWNDPTCADATACPEADLDEDSQIGPADVAVIASNWLVNADVTPPEPNKPQWDERPDAVTKSSLAMEADSVEDEQFGVEYRFECTSGNGPDSDWQYTRTYEPNGLDVGTWYTYRIRARDSSGNLNETEPSAAASARTYGQYWEIADASAAVAIDENFFIVADDEGSRLCIYDSRDMNAPPVASANIGRFLRLQPSHPESDIEGATWLGSRIFWICSHGRNRYGEYWYSRYQFFATSIVREGDEFTIRVDGNYTDLADDLIAYDSVYNLGLADAIGAVGDRVDTRTFPELAPKDEGLNIEGLAATPGGNSLLIGFRNPRPSIDGDTHALLLHLINPEDVVLNGAQPQFDPPILLEFGDMGIRSIEYSTTLGKYLIVAGSHRSGSDEPLQTLYTWDAATGDLDKIRQFPNLTPEAMFQFPADPTVQLLSDDGILLFDTPSGPTENKYLPREQRTYRTHVLVP